MATRIDVCSELVATVIEVAVARGKRVRAGEVLFLLESMKMEIPVLAEVDGSVVDTCVGKGQVVQSGAVLGVLEVESGDR